MYSYPDSNTEKKIALMIINDFFIQKAHELWIFLQLDQCFNDYEATLIWTRRYLEKHPEVSTAIFKKPLFLVSQNTSSALTVNL
jgi:hypothetical protein